MINSEYFKLGIDEHTLIILLSGLKPLPLAFTSHHDLKVVVSRCISQVIQLLGHFFRAIPD